jgi:cell fate (sporulation/competence/biofilm development) regulator YlbF (YheA/YmcA/DUF963 family)
MGNPGVNELELAPLPAVRQAACDFAAALADTAAFKAHEQAAWQLRHDPAAQAALQAYQERQVDQEVLLKLNALSPEEQAEFERLREAYLGMPTVVAFLDAEAELKALCRAAGDMLSQAIELDFGAATRTGCC